MLMQNNLKMLLLTTAKYCIIIPLIKGKILDEWYFFKRRFSRFSHVVKVHNAPERLCCYSPFRNFVSKIIVLGGMLMTNYELLLEMSNMMDRKLNPIKEDIRELKEDVAVLKEDVAVLKEDVAVLKEDVAELKEDVSVLKEGYSRLEKEVRDIRLTQENDVLPRLQNIESCYISTFKRYADGILRMDSLQSDMDVVKMVVTEHSEKIQNLQKWQVAFGQ